MKQLDAGQGFTLPLGVAPQSYLMPDQLRDQQMMGLAAHQPRHEEHNDSNAFRKASHGLNNVSAGVPLEGLEFMGSHIHRMPPQTVSQTPRLKASTYRSPILDPAEIPA